MEGAAEATFFAYFLLWIFHHIVAKYVIKEEYNYKLKQFFVLLCIMIGSCISVTIFKDAIIVRWLCAIVVGIMLLRHIIKQKSIF